MAYWRAEKGDHNDSPADLASKSLKPYNLYVLTKITKNCLRMQALMWKHTQKKIRQKLSALKSTVLFGNAAAVAGTSPKGFLMT